MPEIIVYTRTTCAPCRTLKYWLKKKNIIFTEKNVDDDPSLLSFVIEKSGFLQFPCTVVGDRVISGLNLSLLSSMLMV